MNTTGRALRGAAFFKLNLPGANFNYVFFDQTTFIGRTALYKRRPAQYGPWVLAIPLAGKEEEAAVRHADSAIRSN